MTRDRIRTLLIACLVATVALVVHGRVLHYPFVQDDWGYLIGRIERSRRS